MTRGARNGTRKKDPSVTIFWTCYRPNHHRRRPARPGDPVFQSLSGQTSALWNTGSSAFADDDERICVRILATHCARVLRIISADPQKRAHATLKEEGAGKTGC